MYAWKRFLEMTNRYQRCAWILLFWVSMTLPVLAQQSVVRKHPLPGQFRNELLDHLIQSKNGILWMSGESGLFAYDGHQFAHYPNPDSIDGVITALYEDEHHMVWAGYSNGELARLSGFEDSLHHFEPIATQIGVPITALTSNQQGLWIATRGKGVFLWKDGELFSTYHSHNKLDDVYTLAPCAQDRIWMGHDGGLQEIRCEKNSEKVSFTLGEIFFKDHIVTNIVRSDEDLFWVGFYENGFASFLPKTGLATFPKINWTGGTVEILSLWANRELWIGTAYGGLWRYDIDQNTLHRQYCDASVTNIRVKALMADEEGHMWTTSAKDGLIQLFPTLASFAGPGGDVQAILEDHLGQLWVGTPNGLYLGGVQEECGFSFSETATFLKGIPVISLDQCDRGIIWIGTFGNGLYSLDPKKNILRHQLANDQEFNPNILSIRCDLPYIWITSLGGVTRLNVSSTSTIQEVKHYTAKDGLPAQFMYSSFKDSKGTQWFASDGSGLLRLLPDGKGQRIVLPDGDSTYSVYSITEDHHGHIWFSTPSKGIFQFLNNKVEKANKGLGYPDGIISSLFTDNEGRILVLLENGMVIYQGNNHYWHPLEANLLPEPWQPHLNAIGKGSNYDTWIGSGKDILHYLPLPEKVPIQPHLVLHAATTHDGLPFQDGARLGYKDNFIHFRYAGIWFANPEAVAYRFQLEGYDRDWITSNNHQVIYSHLPPGKYVFRLQVSVNGQFEASEELVYRFSISSPWFQHPLFIGFALVVLLVFIGIGIRWRDQRQRQHSEQQRKQAEQAFEVLKAQINPHFLFNSFNSLQALIEQNPSQAVRFVEELSDFYRIVLTYRNKEVIPIQEEIQIMDIYTQLLKRRYGDALQVLWELRPDQKGYLVPLTLQIMVENAAKHNVATLYKPLRIDIFQQNGDTLVIRNNLQPKLTKEVSTGTGLNNLNSQYQHLAGRGLIINKTSEMFEVIIPIIHPI